MQLPSPTSIHSISLESALLQRETRREYGDQPINLLQLSLLLWAAQGIRNGTKRLTPSAKEQYPLKLYVCAQNIEEVESGIYSYEILDHSITPMQIGLFSLLLENAAIDDQPWVGKAALSMIVTADINNMNDFFIEQPPGNRGMLYSYIETGALSQNVHLQATSLGLGMVLVAGFDNEAVKNVLGLTNDNEPTAILCIGR